MLDECAVRAVRKIRSPKIHDGRLLITYSTCKDFVKETCYCFFLDNSCSKYCLMDCHPGYGMNRIFDTVLHVANWRIDYVPVTVHWVQSLLCELARQQ